MIRLTRHAEERWRERAGSSPPSPPELERIIKESIQLQQFRVYYTPRGRRVKVLAVYSHRGLGLALKVDEGWGTVVTVV